MEKQIGAQGSGYLLEKYGKDRSTPLSPWKLGLY